MLIHVPCPILMGALAGSCSRPRWGIQQKVFWVKDKPVPEANLRKDRSTQRQTDRKELGRERSKQNPSLFHLNSERKSNADPWLFWAVQPE